MVTAITTIWSATPSELAASFHRLDDRFGDRFLLGLGTTHAGVNAPLQAKPLQAMTAMTAMLDGLDDARVPTERRLLGCYQAAVDKLAGVDIAW